MTFISSAMPDIDYQVHNLRDIKIETSFTPSGKRHIAGMTIGSEAVQYSERFATSLAAQCGFAPSIFKFFDHAEVFERIVDRGIGGVEGRFRVALDTSSESIPIALAVSRPVKQIIRADDLAMALREMGIKEGSIAYAKGVVRTTHTPTIMGRNSVMVAGDEMIRRFIAETPIDGYGQPSTYLEMLRTICSNGAIGYSAAFRSQVQIGNTKEGSDDNAMHSWTRFMTTFNNEEGFAAMKERFDVAAKSWASLDEFYHLYKLFDGVDMNSIHRKVGTVGTAILAGQTDEHAANWNSKLNRKMYEIVGDVSKRYGMVSLDSMSTKQRRIAPTEASMYDLINLATEMATHHADLTQSRKIQAWVGNTLQAEYDLEGTREDNEKAEALFLTDAAEIHKN